MADWLTCRLFFFWFESSVADPLQTNLKHTPLCPRGKPHVRRVPVGQKGPWQPADWFCALHITFPLCTPVLGLFLLGDFLSAILWTHRGPIPKTYLIYEAHAVSLLHRIQTVFRFQEHSHSANENLASYLTPRSLAVCLSEDRPGFNSYFPTVFGLCLIFMVWQMGKVLMLGLVWITDGCVNSFHKHFCLWLSRHIPASLDLNYLETQCSHFCISIKLWKDFQGLLKPDCPQLSSGNSRKFTSTCPRNPANNRILMSYLYNVCFLNYNCVG